ncbi:haloacid dehalogenase type II [Streptomyces angustmyceticus]|uniref:Haloacid dehalogenase n=1 Tax=Streptomyces angustmyceticus TaxID=285578 RepID=A0A5J4LLW2_9ACTN|nr:haloacid dehalogenase type II [Streptomyces angustmyceticus]UAL68102.1 haloacid dehalogenase type II [Streptomyces angustmyceticus]GES31538.1 haloacid dehalogenase [Streptomyces angustmyceticus]
MTEASDIEVVVFDVLGTMVDEPGGLRAALHDAVPAADDAAVDHLLTLWREHVEHEQQRIGKRDRPYVNSELIDREAAHRVADRAGLTSPKAIERLATASRRLEPWHDSLAGLARLAGRFPVLGLSHASRATLLRLHAHAGLRWHQALSAEDVRAYKPAPEVYRLALDAAGCPPERVLMVAAHAWDLRGAQAVGMRTAYVRRPGGDAPKSSDTFDWRLNGLDELAAVLAATENRTGA